MQKVESFIAKSIHSLAEDLNAFLEANPNLELLREDMRVTTLSGISTYYCLAVFRKKEEHKELQMNEI